MAQCGKQFLLFPFQLPLIRVFLIDKVKTALAGGDPDLSNRVFGEEREGLTAARFALARMEAGEEAQYKGWVMAVLAWALFANGLDEEAKRVRASMIEVFPPEQRSGALRAQESLAKAIALKQGESGRKALADLEASLAALETEVSKRRTWSFASDSQQFFALAVGQGLCRTSLDTSGQQTFGNLRITHGALHDTRRKSLVILVGRNLEGTGNHTIAAADTD